MSIAIANQGTSLALHYPLRVQEYLPFARPGKGGVGLQGRHEETPRRRVLGRPYRDLSDEEIVTLVKSGEREAFGELIVRYQVKVHSLALKITKNETDAQEVTQDAFLNAFSKLDSFKGASAFSSWLYRVAANGALMLVRSRKREAHEGLDELLPRWDNANGLLMFQSGSEWSTQADRIYERKEICARLQEGFEAIPEGYRKILFLREIDGMSNRDIARNLGISVAAVKSRLHRARLVLRRKLSDYYHR